MMTKRITVNIKPPNVSMYSVVMGSGLLTRTLNWIPKDCSRIVIITDHLVKRHYGSDLLILLKRKGYQVSLLSFPSGEKYKTLVTKNTLETKMLEQYCDRDTLILALGGGVVGDLAGFIAATYMRGIRYIQMPTTMLAMVDSSIGGKTGIDTPQGKNLIGAFWQPKAVIADIGCLSTLPKKHMINGLIEALKVFLIYDAKSFDYLQKHIIKILNSDVRILSNIVQKAVKIKIDIVQKDEKENNLRMVLNFGHTIGHAIEHVSQYKILHGYAVGYGILVEAKIAELMGFLSSKNYKIIESILKQLGILSRDLKKWDVNKVIQATASDKKSKEGKIYYILLKNIGAVYKKNNNYAHIIHAVIVKKAFQAILGASSYGR